MKRLRKENINTPELSERIFKERWRSNPHWVDFERFEKLAKHFGGGRYLDVGCFNSPYPFELALANSDFEVHAIDHARRVVETMQIYFPEVKYEVGDVLNLPYQDNYFDYVVAGEVLEHMENPKALIDECLRVLKKPGWLAMSTPKEEEMRGHSGITDEHLWGFERSDMEALFPNAEIEEYKGMFLVWLRK